MSRDEAEAAAMAATLDRLNAERRVDRGAGARGRAGAGASGLGRRRPARHPRPCAGLASRRRRSRRGAAEGAPSPACLRLLDRARRHDDGLGAFDRGRRSRSRGRGRGRGRPCAQGRRPRHGGGRDASPQVARCRSSTSCSARLRRPSKPGGREARSWSMRSRPRPALRPSSSRRSHAPALSARARPSPSSCSAAIRSRTRRSSGPGMCGRACVRLTGRPFRPSPSGPPRSRSGKRCLRARRQASCRGHACRSIAGAGSERAQMRIIDAART